MRKFLAALVAVSLFFAGSSAKAGFLTVDNITKANFSSIISGTASGLANNQFSFSGTSAQVDGRVASQVFTGAGAFAGYNIFIYQAVHYSGSGSTTFSTFDFVSGQDLTTSFDYNGDADSENIFQITSGPNIGFFPFVQGQIDITSWEQVGDPQEIITVDLAAGKFSRVIGYAVLASKGFALRTSTVTDNLGGTATVSVWAAVPEPASMAIWGIGSLVAGYAGYRRRKNSA